MVSFDVEGVDGAVEWWSGIYIGIFPCFSVLSITYLPNPRFLAYLSIDFDTTTMPDRSVSEILTEMGTKYRAMSTEDQTQIDSLLEQTKLAFAREDMQSVVQLAGEGISALGMGRRDEAGEQAPSQGGTSAANTAVPPTNTRSAQGPPSATGTNFMQRPLTTGTQKPSMSGTDKPPSKND
jgi:hypothetical protein